MPPRRESKMEKLKKEFEKEFKGVDENGLLKTCFPKDIWSWIVENFEPKGVKKNE